MKTIALPMVAAILLSACSRNQPVPALERAIEEFRSHHRMSGPVQYDVRNTDSLITPAVATLSY